MEKNRPLRWGGFLLISALSVLFVFGLTFILEQTILAGASWQTLRHIYVARGVLASFLVMLWAFLFLIRERKGTRSHLQKLSLAVERSPVSIIITDKRGTIEYVNPRFTELTGYQPGEVIGKNPRILKSGETPQETYKNLWKTVTSRKKWEGEFLNLKKNGERYWEAASISPIITPQGEITHYVGILEDVTSKKQLETLKDEFTGTVSHELRTPIAVIKWSLGNLRDGLAGSLTRDQTGLVQVIQKNCDRLERVIRDLLDLSRLEAGKAPAESQPLNIASLIHEVLQNFSEPARKAQLSLLEEIPSEPPPLEGNPDMIVEVLNNLLDNAIRFARKKIAVRAAVEESAIHVSIANDGPDIPPPHQEKLFDKFQQFGRPTGPNGYKGTGLGLSICREIVTRHRGKIWVESSLGKGASFHFTLPLCGKEGL